MIKRRLCSRCRTESVLSYSGGYCPACMKQYREEKKAQAKQDLQDHLTPISYTCSICKREHDRRGYCADCRRRYMREYMAQRRKSTDPYEDLDEAYNDDTDSGNVWERTVDKLMEGE